MRTPRCHLPSAILLLATAVGCSSTDYDLIHAEQSSTSDAAIPDAPVDSMSDAVDATSDADAFVCEPVDFPGPGALRLRNVSSGLCLASGEPILVNNTPGVATTLAPCSGDPVTAWTMIPSPMRGFEVRHISLNLNLDVRQADTADGTSVVLFSPHDLSNQRFIFRARASRGQEMAPWHILSQCVAQRGTDAEIWACDTMDLTQRWELLPEECFP